MSVVDDPRLDTTPKALPRKATVIELTSTGENSGVLRLDNVRCYYPDLNKACQEANHVLHPAWGRDLLGNC